MSQTLAVGRLEVGRQIEAVPRYREQINAARRAAERSRPALRETLIAFAAEYVKDVGWVSAQRLAELLLTGKTQLLWVLQMAAKRNVLVEGGKDAATRWGLAEADWEERKQRLPNYPEMALAEDIASVGYDPMTFRLSLCGNGQLAKTVEGVTDCLVTYAEGMINNGLLGFVDYYENDSAAYCYVLRRIKVETEEASHLLQPNGARYGSRLPEFDRPNLPDGQRTAYLKYEKRWGGARYWTEKHLHLLQRAKEVPFRPYLEPMPVWAERVSQQIPEWLAPQLRVLQGAIIEEQVSEEDLETKDWTLPKVNDVEYDSPAIRLGYLVLAGWNNQNLVFQGDNFRIAEIDGQKYMGSDQGRTKTQADDDINPLPFLLGVASLFFPGGWALRIGRAVAVGVVTRLVTGKK